PLCQVIHRLVCGLAPACPKCPSWPFEPPFTPWYRTFFLVTQGFGHRSAHPSTRRESPTQQPCQQPLHKIFAALWTTLCTVFLSWFMASAPGPEKNFSELSTELSTGPPQKLWITLWTTCGQVPSACG